MGAKKRLAIFFLVLIFATVLFNKVRGLKEQSVWDGQNHINIAIDNGAIELWSLEPSEKSAHVVVIGENVYLSAGSYGSYRAAALGKLSLLEKKDGSLVDAAIEESLHIPIDGVIVRKDGDKSILTPTDYFGVSGFFRLASAISHSQRITNMSLIDLFRLWQLTLAMKKESITRIDLADTKAVTKMILPDGGEGLGIDSDQFSILAKDYFTDKKIREENLTIEVINGTSTIGLANSLALTITNIGGNVISTTKSESVVTKSTVSAKNKSYTVLKIAQLVSGEIRQESDNGRVDVVVTIGEDTK